MKSEFKGLTASDLKTVIEDLKTEMHAAHLALVDAHSRKKAAEQMLRKLEGRSCRT